MEKVSGHIKMENTLEDGLQNIFKILFKIGKFNISSLVPLPFILTKSTIIIYLIK